MGWQNKWKHPGVRGRKPQFVAADCTGIKVHLVPLLNKEIGDIILSLLQHFHFLLLAKRIKLSTAVIVPSTTHMPGRINHDLQNLLLLAASSTPMYSQDLLACESPGAACSVSPHCTRLAPAGQPEPPFLTWLCPGQKGIAVLLLIQLVGKKTQEPQSYVSSP